MSWQHFNFTGTMKVISKCHLMETNKEQLN